VFALTLLLAPLAVAGDDKQRHPHVRGGGKLTKAEEKSTLKAGVRPICQPTKLLDTDPLVRRIVEKDLLVMGRRGRPVRTARRRRGRFLGGHSGRAVTSIEDTSRPSLTVFTGPIFIPTDVMGVPLDDHLSSRGRKSAQLASQLRPSETTTCAEVTELRRRTSNRLMHQCFICRYAGGGHTMNRRGVAGHRGAVGLVLLAAVLCGCRLVNGPERELPLPPDVAPEQVIDADDPLGSVTPLDPDDLADLGREILAAQQQKFASRATGRKFNILALSGGAVYGAYSAGVLCGWTQSGLPPGAGGRPEFDVVTGISTGALIAPFAFLGPKYDDFLRTEYTTTTTEDIYIRQRRLRNVIAESFADNTPFRQRVNAAVTSGVVQELAVEHAKGRRLFIGTTNADTKRIVLWDIGGIATKGGEPARQLIRDVLIASASIPAFFPPVRINVTINGRPYEELHVDGSVSRSLFFRPPYTGQTREQFDPASLSGSNLYVLVAGKINPTPSPVRLRTLPIALDASSTVLYSQTRGDLYRMYTYCLLTGMNLRVSAIPDNLPSPESATEFNPEEMSALFTAGFRAGQKGDLPVPGAEGEELTRDGPAWRDVPPGLKSGEKQGTRTGVNLTVRPRMSGQPAPAPGTEAANRPGPSAPPVR
jgi:predicted acylesterase/phospholipase RssA